MATIKGSNIGPAFELAYELVISRWTSRQLTTDAKGLAP